MKWAQQLTRPALVEHALVVDLSLHRGSQSASQQRSLTESVESVESDPKSQLAHNGAQANPEGRALLEMCHL